ncbi:MAG TPA: class I SAM-dependent methyltransferase [Solirubrobacteraceae bacterium]|nr:class I SAM-dependent methyltransferase [Solirubrobacteraceae bacterium]
MISGERVSTAVGGWGPTWERHVAAYALCGRFLGPGPVLDLGCGVGHSFELLAPRRTIGVDADEEALRGQARETACADMRALPFPDASFDSVLAVQSIEHVPDADRVLAETARVLSVDGVAVFVTPNRLTFGRPDEIIDPYHYVEYDAQELRLLLSPSFAEVNVYGLFGSERVEALLDDQARTMERVLSLDVLRLRRRLSRRARQRLYDAALTLARRRTDPRASEINAEDYWLDSGPLDAALDLVAVGRAPIAGS